MTNQVSVELAGRTLSLETGKIAKFADSSILVKYGDTVVLITVVCNPPRDPRDYLPLLVEYREHTYAVGRIPGGFFKREGRPKEREILYGRAIDRAIRPLFPKGMIDDLEVVAFLFSYDMQNEGNILGLIGASAALSVSDIPFQGPVGAVRVGYSDGEYILNPTNTQMEASQFDLLVAGDGEQVSMLEFTGDPTSEEIIEGAIDFAIPYVKQTCDIQMELYEKIGKPKREPFMLEIPDGLEEELTKRALPDLKEALKISEKKTRSDALKDIRDKAIEALEDSYPETTAEISYILYKMEREIMRDMVLNQSTRIDARDFTSVRSISSEIDLLPRTHGSALFTRGETQALVVTTLGTGEDEQRLSELETDDTKRFMLHYNFHPFSVGEVKPLRGPSRREIGHGFLAEKALTRLIPDGEEFPYTIRVVSDVLQSNGSTSMATVCGASLSLMNAGVPIKAACAGVCIGLVQDDDKSILLTDILGDEDHYGDMDFKVAGTREGITAIQLDLKIQGIPKELVSESLKRARDGRHFILDIMDSTISEPRQQISQYAPKVTAIFIPSDKIGLVIGPGGRMIRKITEETGTKIDIKDDDGRVVISGDSLEGIEAAKTTIEELVQDVEINQIYKGRVVKTTTFGAFVEVLPGKEGLLHISELAPHRVNKVEDVVKVGDEVEVKVIAIDDAGKVKLSRKSCLPGAKDSRPRNRDSRPRSDRRPSGSGRDRDRRPPRGRRDGDRIRHNRDREGT
jgi:polyribonucleotide nucleotidyltransferase